MTDSNESEFHSLRGPIDRPALLTIRDVFERDEPLADPALDEFLNPRVLEVRYDDGLLDAESCRIDIQWTTHNDYKYHYTDVAGRDLRWGRHPHNDEYEHVTGLAHFHPPPDASSNPTAVAESCIELTPEHLVTRAVITLWRSAYQTDTLDPLNTGDNPP
jgi:hypothetical protein